MIRLPVLTSTVSCLQQKLAVYVNIIYVYMYICGAVINCCLTGLPTGSWMSRIGQVD